MHASLSGQTVAITGGARGIGRAIGSALARRGMTVAIGDVDLIEAQRTASEIGARPYSLDVTSPESFAAFLDAVEADLGPLDVLINNAGIMPVGRFCDESPDATSRQHDVNIGGVVTGCRLFLPRATARGHGHVVNMSSIAGRTGYAGLATYSGTKFYVYGFSEALRGELAGTGVHVTAVMPGFVSTELTAGISEARVLKSIGPDDVADRVVRALESPRFDVFAPVVLGPMGIIVSMLPRRARDAALRLARADRLVLEADVDQRAAYEARVGTQRQRV